jgi:hypothetical protein
VRSTTVIFLIASLVGCSDERASSAADSAAVLPPPPTTPAFGGGAPAYATIDVAGGGGRISGESGVEGDFPRDTIVRPAGDEQVCGDAFLDTTISRSGDRLAGVVVWLVDARSGKPLSLNRRFELTHSRCRLRPRVQAVRVGGTLNIRSADRTVHDARFLRAADSSTIAVVSEHDAGQVVPDERVLAMPGRIEVRCDVHPWTRGWILVFDHPYYEMTDRRGSFAMDSVPPGRYRLIAWHERFEPIDATIEVARGETAEVNIVLRARE